MGPSGHESSGHRPVGFGRYSLLIIAKSEDKIPLFPRVVAIPSLQMTPNRTFPPRHPGLVGGRRLRRLRGEEHGLRDPGPNRTSPNTPPTPLDEVETPYLAPLIRGPLLRFGLLSHEVEAEGFKADLEVALGQ